MSVRKDPPRWSKLPVWVAAAVAAWMLLFVLWRAAALWPWPTGCLFAGVLIGLLAGGRWRRQLRAELEAERATVDRWNHGDTLYALDEVGRIEPDRPEPVLYDQDADPSFKRYSIDAGPWAGASHLQADPADDTGTGTIAHLRSGEWAPAAPARKQVGQ